MTEGTKREEEYRLIIGQYSNETKIGALERLQDERDSFEEQSLAKDVALENTREAMREIIALINYARKKNKAIDGDFVIGKLLTAIRAQTSNSPSENINPALRK